MVGKYVSVEGEIERTKGDYYGASPRARAAGTRGRTTPARSCATCWDGARLLPELSDRVSALRGAGATKAGRVEEALRRSVGRVTKADLLEACPGVSRTTVERALAAMLADGKIL